MFNNDHLNFLLASQTYKKAFRSSSYNNHIVVGIFSSSKWPHGRRKDDDNERWHEATTPTPKRRFLDVQLRDCHCTRDQTAIGLFHLYCQCHSLGQHISIWPASPMWRWVSFSFNRWTGLSTPRIPSGRSRHVIAREGSFFLCFCVWVMNVSDNNYCLT